MRFLILTVMLAISQYHGFASIPGQIVQNPGVLKKQSLPGDKTLEGFRPELFGKITSSTLPQENGIPIVARINGKPVSWETFDMHARVAGARLFHQYPGQEDSIYAALAAPLKEGIILVAIYDQYAERQNLKVQPSEIEQRVKQTRNNANAQTMNVLSQLTGTQIRELARENLMEEKVNKYIGDLATSTVPTQEDISGFIREMNPTTAPMEVLRARHIVVRATPDMSDFNINDAKAKADDILQRIQNGLDFGMAARQYSQDRFTAFRSGDLGYFLPKNMYPEFTSATKGLEPGDISGVIRTPVGYHIIQLTERHSDNLLLQTDKYRSGRALNLWKHTAGLEARVEYYLDK